MHPKDFRLLQSATNVSPRSVPDLRGDVRTSKLGDRPNTRRRGDVDLGEIAVDDIDADKQQSALAQCGTDPLTDLALAGRQIGRLRCSAADHIGAQIIRGGHAIDGTGEFAVDEDDAFVAMLHFRQETLDHPWLAKRHREHIEQRSEIHVLRHYAKNSGSAVTMQRLHHNRAVLGAK